MAIHAAAVNSVQPRGFNDWRLSSRRELLSLVDHDTSLVIDTDYFPNTARSRYWSADSFEEQFSLARLVNFGNGN